MCGLSAIFSQTGYDGHSIKSLNDAIKHRGPDGEGFSFSSNAMAINTFGEDTPQGAIDALKLTRSSSLHNESFNAMLGHRRLSIVDTSWRGHQPMTSSCGLYSIIYNGEIYNSDELMVELELLGHSFVSHSDTEVVLAAFIQWGKNCLEKLNGMFSFIIFNHQTNQVFLARDRFGIKPLYYYYLNENSIAFASEIKQFSKLACWSAVVNRAKAIDYLNWGQTDHTSETLFEGVYQVPAAHFCEFNVSSVPQKLEFTSWYSIDLTRSSKTYDEAVKSFRDVFSSSVQYRLKADVPIGTCLSGGLDSSSIACTINRFIDDDQMQVTFSSCSSDKKYDESEYVEAVLDKCENIHAHMIEINHDDFWDELDDLIYHHDEPFLSPSVYAEWCIFREVSKTNVKVTLDGHGADEILIGYYTFFGPYLSGLLRRLRFLEYAKAVFSIRSMHGYSLGRLMAMSIRSFLPQTIKQYALKLLNRPSTIPEWINQFALNTPISDIGMSDENIENVSLDQLLRFSVPKQLKWCDRDSMAHSIESRVPFLDFRLVDLVYSLPSDYKFKRGLTKRILRDGLSGVIPNEVKNRINKMGFVTPGERWVLDNPKIYKLKLKNAIQQAGVLLNGPECYERFSCMIDGNIPFNNTFWRIIFFGEWIKCYKVTV
jgi:asparagine synthase (glutamine-hydrolysing)